MEYLISFPFSPMELSMKRPASFLTLSLLAASLLHAEVPSSVLFQGYLTSNGTPANGSQTLLVKACDALVDGTCKTVFNDKVQASNGYYTALLQNLPSMDKPYWLEVASNGSLLSERIALTATPYALRAAVSDSATGAWRASSALTALNADLATRAKLADSAISALKAVNAILATKASLADSAVAALRAVNATLAAKALFADSATAAVRAVTATNAVNATNADNVTGGYVTSLNSIQGAATLAAGTNMTITKSGSVLTINGPTSVANATNAVNATNATYATIAGAVTGGHVTSLNSIQGAATISAGTNMTITKSGSDLTINGPTSVAYANSAATASSVNSLTGTVSTTYLQLNYHPFSTDLPACDASMRGRLYMCANPSSYAADVPCWCQSYGNPGGSGYRWAYLDYAQFSVR